MSSQTSLVIFDMEGTLTADPTVWELMHLKVGTWDTYGLPYWRSFCAGDISYDDFARMDVATWRGAPSEFLDKSVDEVPLMQGCTELFEFLSARGIRTAIVSNGLERLARRLAKQFSIEQVCANREVVRDGCLTGELQLHVPFDGKGDAVRRLMSHMGVREDSVLAVGDGPADIEMFRCAGRSIAFRPSNEDVAAAADNVVAEPDLARLKSFLE